jgi:TolB protein
MLSGIRPSPRRPPVTRRIVALLALAPFLVPAAADAQWTNRYTQVGQGHHVYLEGYELPTLTAGPMDPAPSPDGSTLAVASEGWLWLVDLRTRVATQLTDGGAMDSRPKWSRTDRRSSSCGTTARIRGSS